MMYTAVIIDDDQINIDLLSALLNMYCPQIAVLATATNIDSGIQVIVQHKPQILYLDIEIHDKTGFDLLKCVDTKQMKVVMITGYEKYAIQAIKSAVNDYLLKPVQISELVEATNKLIAIIGKETEAEPQAQYKDFLALPSKHDLDIKGINDIIRLEAQSNYTKIVTITGETHITSRTLKEYEHLFPSSTFIRVHKSHIINLNHVIRYIKSKHGTLLMRDQVCVPISESKKREVALKINF